MAQPQTKTHWRQIHRRLNEDMLFAEDLGGYGCKPLDVEIVESGVTAVRGDEGKKDMPYLVFRGKKGPSKRLGLNAGMCKVMQTLTGTDIIEDWRGWVTLLVVKAQYTDSKTKQRLETDAIRISTKRPRAHDADAPRLAAREEEAKQAAEERRTTAIEEAKRTLAELQPTDPPLTDEERRALALAEKEMAGDGD